jgi:hypothetical protein
MASNPGTTTIAEFQAQVAKEIQAISREQQANESRLSGYLRKAGINADVIPGDSGDYKVTLKPDENAGLPEGTKRSDFTHQALAAMDAKALAKEKERTYQVFRSMHRNGYYTSEQSAKALKNLGYTTAPVTETEVSVTFDSFTRDQYGDGMRESVAFTLPGEVSTEDAKAALEAAVEPPAINAAVRKAFPQAQGLRGLVRYVHASQKTTWADHSEFWTAPED